MNKKKLFITLALVAVIACAALLFGACEMISDEFYAGYYNKLLEE